MGESIVISIDAMGGDHGPPVIIDAIAQAIKKQTGFRYLLHGDSALIETALTRHPAAAAVCEVRHTQTSIGAHETAAQAVRRGRGSSLWNAIDAIRSGEARACVSAGNTGALMAIARRLVGMIDTIDRPAIIASWPSLSGLTTVLDLGANLESDADQLVQFAVMGAVFHHAIYGSSRPTVGLLNVGSEDQKGHEEVREAHRILSQTALDLDYRGFVEGNDICRGTVDIVVTDGFSGNVALKTAEGMLGFVSEELKSTLKSGPIAMLGGLLASRALRKMRARIDPRRSNGAPLLGLNGIVVKSHGGADSHSYAAALCAAGSLARGDFIADMDRNLKRAMTDYQPLARRA